MKKLKLKSLKLQSFVTEMEEKTRKTIRGKGGGFMSLGYDCHEDYHPACGASDSCHEEYSDHCPSEHCSRTCNTGH